MLKDLFRRKSMDQLVAEAEEPEHRLKKALGPVDVTAIGIGGIIGAGIFATIGTAAAGDATRPGAGPGLILSFILTGIACGFAALCYAEFAAMIPVSGSAYTYAYAALGELIAWIIGWDLIIEYAVGNIGVAISWGNYFKTFVEAFKWPDGTNVITIPNWLSIDLHTAYEKPSLLFGHAHWWQNAPLPFGPEGHSVVFNVLAVGIMVFLTGILVWGVKESARFNAAMVVIKI